MQPLKIYDAGEKSGQPCVIEGRVSDRYFKKDRYIIEIHNVRILTNPADRKKSQNKTEYLRGAVCYMAEDFDGSEKALMGQTLRLKGKIYSFERARNPGEFDLAEYRAVHGFDISLMEAEIMGHGRNYNKYSEFLKEIRERTAEVFKSYLAEEDAAVLSAMLLGDKSSLDPSLKDLYKRAGISHILSISGLHVSVIGLGLYRLLLRLSRKRIPSLILSLIFVISYAEMTGGTASVIRASIMLGSFMTAEIIGRSYDILSAMSLSMIIILIMQPAISTDAGFLLSFGAVSGIAIVGPLIKRVLDIKIPKLLQSMEVSFSVTLFTLPVVLYFYYQIPLFSIFLNLIIVPLMSLLMIMAIILALIGSAALPAGVIPAAVCRLILDFYEFSCRIFSGAEGLTVVAGRPSNVRIFLYYLVFFSLAAFIPKIKEKKNIRLIGGAGLALMMVLMFFKPHHGLEYLMLDIGQGDCNFLRSPAGVTYLVDCGSSDEKEIAKYKLIPALKSMGVSEIDIAVMTHPDADHINGFEEVLKMEKGEGIRIKSLLMPDIGEKDEAYLRFMELAERKGCRIRLIKKGDGFSDGEMEVKCLNPEKGCRAESANAYSTVLSVKYRNFSLLLTGDVEGQNEEELKDAIKDRYTVLKLAHHGSKNSTPEELLRKIDPAFALISCGRKNRYGHPHEETIEKLEAVGAETFITKDVGAIEIKTDGNKIKIKEFIKKDDKKDQ